MIKSAGRPKRGRVRSFHSSLHFSSNLHTPSIRLLLLPPLRSSGKETSRGTSSIRWTSLLSRPAFSFSFDAPWHANCNRNLHETGRTSHARHSTYEFRSFGDFRVFRFFVRRPRWKILSDQARLHRRGGRFFRFQRRGRGFPNWLDWSTLRLHEN